MAAAPRMMDMGIEESDLLAELMGSAAGERMQAVAVRLLKVSGVGATLSFEVSCGEHAARVAVGGSTTVPIASASTTSVVVRGLVGSAPAFTGRLAFTHSAVELRKSWEQVISLTPLAGCTVRHCDPQLLLKVTGVGGGALQLPCASPSVPLTAPLPPPPPPPPPVATEKPLHGMTESDLISMLSPKTYSSPARGSPSRRAVRGVRPPVCATHHGKEEQEPLAVVDKQALRRTERRLAQARLAAGRVHPLATALQRVSEKSTAVNLWKDVDTAERATAWGEVQEGESVLERVFDEARKLYLSKEGDVLDELAHNLKIPEGRDAFDVVSTVAYALSLDPVAAASHPTANMMELYVLRLYTQSPEDIDRDCLWKGVPHLAANNEPQPLATSRAMYNSVFSRWDDTPETRNGSVLLALRGAVQDLVNGNPREMHKWAKLFMTTAATCWGLLSEEGGEGKGGVAPTAALNEVLGWGAPGLGYLDGEWCAERLGHIDQALHRVKLTGGCIDIAGITQYPEDGTLFVPPFTLFFSMGESDGELKFAPLPFLEKHATFLDTVRGHALRASHRCAKLAHEKEVREVWGADDDDSDEDRQSSFSAVTGVSVSGHDAGSILEMVIDEGERRRKAGVKDIPVQRVQLLAKPLEELRRLEGLEMEYKQACTSLEAMTGKLEASEEALALAQGEAQQALEELRLARDEVEKLQGERKLREEAERLLDEARREAGALHAKLRECEGALDVSRGEARAATITATQATEACLQAKVECSVAMQQLTAVKQEYLAAEEAAWRCAVAAEAETSFAAIPQLFEAQTARIRTHQATTMLAKELRGTLKTTLAKALKGHSWRDVVLPHWAAWARFRLLKRETRKLQVVKRMAAHSQGTVHRRLLLQHCYKMLRQHCVKKRRQRQQEAQTQRRGEEALRSLARRYWGRWVAWHCAEEEVRELTKANTNLRCEVLSVRLESLEWVERVTLEKEQQGEHAVALAKWDCDMRGIALKKHTALELSSALHNWESQQMAAYNAFVHGVSDVLGKAIPPSGNLGQCIGNAQLLTSLVAQEINTLRQLLQSSQPADTIPRSASAQIAFDELRAALLECGAEWRESLHC